MRKRLWHVRCTTLRMHSLVFPRRATCALAVGLSVALLPAVASAQQVVASPSQPDPDRVVGGADLGPSTRSAALNPHGVNYDDCKRDMTLRFTVALSSFTADTQLAVWAGRQGTDCSLDASRTGTPVCWKVVRDPLTGLTATGASPPIDVRVRDLVGPQGHAPPDGSYPNAGVEACSAQTGLGAVPMSIWFIPVDASGHVVGGSGVFAYALTTDLVGPPPPSMKQPGVGDTMMVVNWTPNADSDTVGYDVYRDPAPGGALGVAPDAGGGAQVDCPDGGDAGCVRVVSGGGLLDAGVCHSAALSAGTFVDAGAGDAADGGVALDDAGNPVSGDQGGIGAVPDAYRVAGSSADMTVWGESTGSFTMLGLQNGTMLGVTVAAVDASGNVGPPASVKCDYPDVVSDFYQRYGADGGGAGCAIGAAGMASSPEDGSTAGAVLALAALAARFRASNRAAPARPSCSSPSCSTRSASG